MVEEDNEVHQQDDTLLEVLGLALLADPVVY